MMLSRTSSSCLRATTGATVRATVIVRVRSRCGAKASNRRSFFSRSKDNKNQRSTFSSAALNSEKRDPYLAVTGVLSDPEEVEAPKGLPSRAEQIRRLKKSSETPFDVLIIGGGATGSGCALDASVRGLSTACIERGDFASETSSRSTKLVWAGIKYMATATSMLLSTKLLTSPITTVKDFYSEIKMVFHCHQERRFMLDKQEHLTNWVPIAMPFTTWYVSPPPFKHPLFGLFPILAPPVLKIYDGLSAFTCPPSYIMGKKKTREVFPQLASEQGLKYCAVFYEGQHNDARTNVAIAMTAAEKGAAIANYVEMVDSIKDPATGKVVGVTAYDRMTGKSFEVRAKRVIFAGGPFTDGLREMEIDGAKAKEEMPKAVRGASGTHIVLPGYYSPAKMGLLDYNTSDGRFLFMLPWQGHTLVGTTDAKGPAQTSPSPPEEEIEWLLEEAGKYLDVKLRRSDVLSSWRGWRPLAADPHAPPGAPVSRDHIISENPDTGVVFIAGGKWTTWREMAEDVLNRVVGDFDHAKPCTTLDVKLFGGEGYHKNLSIELIQKYGLAENVAENMVKSYGARAWEVCELIKPSGKRWPKFGKLLVENYPYTEADVQWACKEYACTIEDVLSRRTRLAFLNKEAALEAIPAIADIMAKELGWSAKVKKMQIESAETYANSYGGTTSGLSEDKLKQKADTFKTVKDVFDAIDSNENGFLEENELSEVAVALGLDLSPKELAKAFKDMDADGKGRVSIQEFVDWWSTSSHSPLYQKLSEKLSLKAMTTEELRKDVWMLG